jgi:predicted O-methyltransferase YrrM
MSFKYPNKFTYPEGERIFFQDHIEIWEKLYEPFQGRPNVVLEIGSLYGASAVFILETFCKEKDSHFYIMDINKTSFLEKNLEPYHGKFTFLQGESNASFRKISHQGSNKEFLDLVYIDGNHLSKYVLEDAVNAFYCLKENGIMIFDDFGGGLEQPEHMRVMTAVESLLHSYGKYLKVIHQGYQIFLQKIGYQDENELKENYYTV